MDKSHKTQNEDHSKTIGPINNGQVTQNTNDIRPVFYVTCPLLIGPMVLE
jgi:hypothetical protein